MLKKTLVGALVILLVMAAGGYLLPSTYKAQRSIDVNAPASVIFDFVNHPKRSEVWSPWIAADPQSVLTYNDIAEGVGAGYVWNGPQSGEGEAVIVDSIPGERILMKMDFKQQGPADSIWTLSSGSTSTRVTWVIQGDTGLNPLGRYFGLLVDNIIGPMLDDGLRRLKKVSEESAQVSQ